MRHARRFIAGRALSTLLAGACLFPFCARLCGETGAQTPVPSPAHTSGELLQSAALSADWGERYASVTRIKYRATVEQGPVHYVVGDDAIVKKYLDGAREHLIFELIGSLAPSGAYMANPSRRETVLAGGSRISWWLPLDRPLIGTVQIARSPDRVRSMKLLDQSDSHAGAFLDGVVNSLGNVVDLAKAGSVSSEVRCEQVDGVPCDVVESTISGGKVSLWIAPSEGHNVIKFILQKDTGDQSPMHEEFEATAIENLGGRSVIRAGRSQCSSIDSTDKAKWQETVEADRLTLDLHPDFSEPNLFTTNDIPDGIRVLLDDMPNVGIDFIWSHGKPVAKVDDNLFTDLAESVQKTTAGEIPKSSPPPVHLESIPGIEDGRRRMMQLCIALCSIAAILLAMLIGIYLRRGGFHATQ
jgi:hypothetical protein